MYIVSFRIHDRESWMRFHCKEDAFIFAIQGEEQGMFIYPTIHEDARDNDE